MGLSNITLLVDLLSQKLGGRNGCPATPFLSELVISYATNAECEAVHEVRRLDTSVLFVMNCTVHQVLKTGT